MLCVCSKNFLSGSESEKEVKTEIKQIAIISSPCGRVGIIDVNLLAVMFESEKFPVLEIHRMGCVKLDLND